MPIMGRTRRVDVGGMVYHAEPCELSFPPVPRTRADYQAFLGILEESLNFVPMRILAYCLMPNHWHLVLYPASGRRPGQFLQRVTMTHTQRYHARTGRGTGTFIKADISRCWSSPTAISGAWFATWKETPSAPACQEGRGLAVVERSCATGRKRKAKEAAQPLARGRAAPLSAMAQPFAREGRN